MRNGPGERSCCTAPVNPCSGYRLPTSSSSRGCSPVLGMSSSSTPGVEGSDVRLGCQCCRSAPSPRGGEESRHRAQTTSGKLDDTPPRTPIDRTADRRSRRSWRTRTRRPQDVLPVQTVPFENRLLQSHGVHLPGMSHPAPDVHSQLLRVIALGHRAAQSSSDHRLDGFGRAWGGKSDPEGISAAGAVAGAVAGAADARGSESEVAMISASCL